MTTADPLFVADTLHAAADLLDQLAGAASPGPWWTDGGRSIVGATGDYVVASVAARGLWPSDEDAAYIGAMNPRDVGLPLATLLRNLATLHRERRTVDWPSEALRDLAHGVLASKGARREDAPR